MVYNHPAARGILGLMSGRVPSKLSEDSFGGTRANIEPSMPRATGDYNIITKELRFSLSLSMMNGRVHGQCLWLTQSFV